MDHGRPLREGVDRNWIRLRVSQNWVASRPLREGVDRNLQLRDVLYYSQVALYARAWVEISWEGSELWQPTGRPLREGVGRNPDIFFIKSRNGLSPSTRGRG